MVELERLKTINASLEKVNLKLESENLTLSLSMEKEKAEMKRLIERNRQLEKLATLHEATEDASEVIFWIKNLISPFLKACDEISHIRTLGLTNAPEVFVDD